VEELIHLRDEFGTTHLVIDRKYYSEARASYFKPFDTWIEKAYAKLGGAEPAALRQAETATVFEHGSLVVIDLRKLRRGGSAEGLSNETH